MFMKRNAAVEHVVRASDGNDLQSFMRKTDKTYLGIGNFSVLVLYRLDTKSLTILAASLASDPR